mmetsp:Transcript_39836/g.118129  ORF Transcript_39836/g.118129 Transcript_39836/m.118129 type:complete len:212 (-) Transcript_39836:676-1311(-)
MPFNSCNFFQSHSFSAESLAASVAAAGVWAYFSPCSRAVPGASWSAPALRGCRSRPRFCTQTPPSRATSVPSARRREKRAAAASRRRASPSPWPTTSSRPSASPATKRVVIFSYKTGPAARSAGSPAQQPCRPLPCSEQEELAFESEKTWNFSAMSSGGRRLKDARSVVQPFLSSSPRPWSASARRAAFLPPLMYGDHPLRWQQEHTKGPS